MVGGRGSGGVREEAEGGGRGRRQEFIMLVRVILVQRWVVRVRAVRYTCISIGINVSISITTVISQFGPFRCLKLVKRCGQRCLYSWTGSTH